VEVVVFRLKGCRFEVHIDQRGVKLPISSKPLYVKYVFRFMVTHCCFSMSESVMGHVVQGVDSEVSRLLSVWLLKGIVARRALWRLSYAFDSYSIKCV
jgi:hypothetical protein